MTTYFHKNVLSRNLFRHLNQWGTFCYTHFIGEGIEEQRGKQLAWGRNQSQDFHLRLSAYKDCSPNH